jgi:hypothetical protein
LTELIGQESFAVAGGMDERGSAIMISFRLDGILLLKKQADNADVNFEFLFVFAVRRLLVKDQYALVD